MKALEPLLYDQQVKLYHGNSSEEVMELRKCYLTPPLTNYYRKSIVVVEG